MATVDASLPTRRVVILLLQYRNHFFFFPRASEVSGRQRSYITHVRFISRRKPNSCRTIGCEVLFTIIIIIIIITATIIITRRNVIEYYRVVEKE